MASPNESQRTHQAPELNAETLIRDKLKSDFYMSFRFAQGETITPLHHYLLLALALNYGKQFPAEALHRLSSDKEFADSLSAMSPPYIHRRVSNGDQPIDSDKARETFGTYSAMLQSDLLLVATDKASHLSEWYLPREIARLSIARDIFYQFDDHPREYPGVGPRCSLFREHVVLGIPTGSDAFDEIFAEVGAYVAEETDRGGDIGPIYELVQRWELNHPGEAFYPIAA